jgi:putative ABC transport system ATP-binding protein
MQVIKARELYRFFHTGDEEVKALRGVDLDASAGEVIALMGPSGSGKSTLLMCLAGLDEPDAGSVTVMGETMSRKPEAEKLKLRSRHLGVMRQKDNLFAHLTVSNNIELAHSLSQQSQSHDILARMGMTGRGGSLPPQLSGGERARAGLAVAMASGPAALLLDEPTGEVDAETESVILEILRDFRNAGGSIIVATHNPAVAAMADRVMTMQDGKVMHG